jgi:hypothetical protein
MRRSVQRGLASETSGRAAFTLFTQGRAFRMDLVTPAVLGGVCAALLGLMLIASGLHAQRGARLRYRQGAQVLVGTVIVIGVAVVIAGILLVLM